MVVNTITVSLISFFLLFLLFRNAILVSVQGASRTVMSNPTWNNNSWKVPPFFNYMALLQVGLMMC